jgi:hypothetical protein
VGWVIDVTGHGEIVWRLAVKDIVRDPAVDGAAVEDVKFYK